MEKDNKSASHTARIRQAAPGPSELQLESAGQDNPLNFLLSITRAYGDVAQYATEYGPVYLVNHPDFVEQILHDDRYVRTPLLKMALGEGLVTSEGAYWRGQRRLMQPAFHQQCIAAFDKLTTDATVAMLRQWQEFADTDQPIELPREMMRLTLGIIGNALFGADLSDEGDTLGEAITTIIEDLGSVGRTLFTSQYSMSPSRNRRFEAALQTVDRIVYRIINDRRQGNSKASDLLSLLLSGRDEETDESLNGRQLRDEVVTMLVAGHESTANMLSWTWYLLHEYPSVERLLHAELARVLGGRLPTVKDLPHLKYNRMILQESLRLYPPVWFIVRKPLMDGEIGGYEIPANSRVVVSPYAMHRHPTFWQDPERFDPERFTPERSAGRPRYAYFPFGGGKHICLGNNLAMMEGQLVLATVAQHYRLRLVPGHSVEPQPLVSLRHRYGLPMTLHSRTSTSIHG